MKVILKPVAVGSKIVFIAVFSAVATALLSFLGYKTVRRLSKPESLRLAEKAKKLSDRANSLVGKGNKLSDASEKAKVKEDKIKADAKKATEATKAKAIADVRKKEETKAEKLLSQSNALKVEAGKIETALKKGPETTPASKRSGAASGTGGPIEVAAVITDTDKSEEKKPDEGKGASAGEGAKKTVS